MPFEVSTTPLPGVVLLNPAVYEDERGLFLETWQDQDFHAVGLTERFVQDNLSRSNKNVLRGLHYQVKQPQAQLVTVMHGAIYDVVVDLRRQSPTYGQWCDFELNAEKPQQLYMPPGCAHGFCVLSDQADVHYKVTQFYTPGDEGGIVWNDPSLDIPWPLSAPTVGSRDAAYPKLSDIPADKLPHIDYQEPVMGQ